jgi:ferritin-like metal-binding protein YciE
MAINNPADLLAFELSACYDGEVKDAALKGEIADQISDGALAQEFRNEQQKCQQKIANVDACFQTLGTSRMDVSCQVMDGVRGEFQQFLAQQPSPQTVEMFAVGSTAKIASYKAAECARLVDKATLLGQPQCAALMQTNLVMTEESAKHFQRIGHDLAARALVRA